MKNKLPESFVSRILKQFPQFADELLASLNGPVNPSVHVNIIKGENLFPNHHSVEWNPQGYYLHERPIFTLDPLFHAGAYYSQESSSMFLAHIAKYILDDFPYIRALDACAAPGGKSILLSDAIGDRGFLICNEYNRKRFSILEENLIKWGNGNTILTSLSTGYFKKLPNYFDLILIDAPCSGEGMFRKDENAREEWNPGLPGFCALRQREIIDDLAECIRPGGYLIYSTCTFAEEENMDQVLYLERLGFESVAIPINAQWPIVTLKKGDCEGYAFLPHLVKGEGFFVSVLKKKGVSSSFNLKKQKDSSVYKKITPAFKWLNRSDLSLFVDQEDEIRAYPFAQEEWANIHSVLNHGRPGIPIGKLIRNDMVPHHGLAMSSWLSSDCRSTELSLEDSIRYLRKDQLHLPNSDGWSTVSYENIRLGWIKSMKNRINNYYPVEWRIRMASK